jgi:hypothetical protein
VTGLSDAIPDKSEAIGLAQAEPAAADSPDRLTREKLIFRSYDSMNVNVRRSDG